jgi:heterodisulfide reductase subunit C
MAVALPTQTGRISRKQIETLSKQQISTCYQCQKCTNGCPMTFAMDTAPHQVIHKVQLGLIDELIDSDTIWVCASCETCTARCPNDIDIAHVMDTLRHLSIKKGVKASQKQAPIFHKSFLSSVKNLGRMNEFTMAIDYTLKSTGLKGLLKQSALGMNMVFKGKMKLIPKRSANHKEIKNIFRAAEEK